MVISLIHPSRGRPQKSFDNVQRWLEKAGIVRGGLEILIAIDESDAKANEYFKIYEDINVIRIKSPARSVVEATNTIATYSRGDVLIYLSDDFDCPDNWYSLIENEFEGETKPMLLKVDDCLQKFHIPVLTIPIMNRALYEKLGYFWHPGYKSMFVDEDLYWTAKKLGAIKNAEHLKFPHEHVSIGKSEDDETYRNSAKNWNQGKAFFEKRKRSGFQL